MTASPTPIRSFDPVPHLTKVNGGDYLKVEHRLAWLRAEHPDAELTTELVEHLSDLAIFRARVELPTGGSATGWGSESPGDFRDYLEKAETKAIGRALAALGFGTQFATDHEDGAPRRPADAPVRQAARKPSPSNESATEPAPPGNLATARQLGYLRAVGREAGYEGEALVALSRQYFHDAPEQLSRRDCSAFIDMLQNGTLPIQ